MSSPTVTGRLTLHARGFGFLQIDEGPGDGPASAFVAPPDLRPFLAGDRARAELVDEGDERWSCRRLTLVERTREELVGEVVRRRGATCLRPDPLLAAVDWPLYRAEGVAPGALVVARVEGDRAVFAQEVAPADAGRVRVLVRWGIRRGFPAGVEAEVAAARPPAAEERRDLRDVPTVTIDGPSTRDIDDALAVIPAGDDGGLRVLVSIADVDALVPAGSALDREAEQRGTSVYLPDEVVPMLPRALSEQALSLLEGADRLALTCELRIDPEGQVTSVDLYESLIRSHARLTYEAAADYLDEGLPEGVPEAVRPTLRWLRTAAARLSAVRAGRGGLAVVREEARLTVEGGEVTEVDVREETSAHRLVERLMVAANEAVARWLVERGLPGVFRVHPEPEREEVEALAEFSRNFGFECGFGARLTPLALAAFERQYRSTQVAPALEMVMRRVLGPARYTVHPGAHFGLAAPLYLHFTSPIRRYADLLVHRLVKAYLEGRRDLRPGDPELEARALALNHAALRARKAENERLRMLAARLFAGRVGEAYEGHVVAVKPFGLVVQLTGTGVTGTLAIDALPDGPYHVDPRHHALIGGERRYTLGQALDVEVAGADEELGRIELRLRPPRRRRRRRR